MTAKERLKAYLDYKKITQIAFAESIGASTGYVNAMSKGFGPKYEAIVREKYPDLNIGWVMTGEGEMLHGATEEAAPHNRIRYWVDVDATAGGVTLFDDQVTNKYIDLDIPEFRDCTDAVNLYGDSMLPLYKSGQIIILKEWMESFIDYGNVYLVITKKGNRMVKYLRKGSDAQHVLCVSENKDFDPFEIEKEDILRLYVVKGGISKNTL